VEKEEACCFSLVSLSLISRSSGQIALAIFASANIAVHSTSLAGVRQTQPTRVAVISANAASANP